MDRSPEEAGCSGSKILKIWSSDRTRRKGVVAISFTELTEKGKKKFNLPSESDITFVLEADGTEIDDEYFLGLPNNTVIMMLVGEETWVPVQPGCTSCSKDVVNDKGRDEEMEAKLGAIMASIQAPRRGKPKKSTRRLTFGWVNYNWKQRRYVQVRSKTGNVTKDVDRNITFRDAMEIMKGIFFHRGKSDKGKLKNMTVKVGKMDGSQYTQSMDDVIATSLSKVYLQTKLNIRDLTVDSDSENDSESSSDSGSLYDPQFSPPKKKLCLKKLTAPDVFPDVSVTHAPFGSLNVLDSNTEELTLSSLQSTSTHVTPALVQQLSSPYISLPHESTMLTKADGQALSVTSQRVPNPKPIITSSALRQQLSSTFMSLPHVSTILTTAVGQTEFVASPHPPNPTSSVSSALGQQLNPPFISLPHVSTAVGQPASLVLQNSTKTSTSTALQQDQSEALPAVVQSTTTPSKAVRPQSSPDLSRFPHSRTMTTAVTPSQCQTTPRPSHAGAAGMSGTPTLTAPDVFPDVSVTHAPFGSLNVLDSNTEELTLSSLQSTSTHVTPALVQQLSSPYISLPHESTMLTKADGQALSVTSQRVPNPKPIITSSALRQQLSSTFMSLPHVSTILTTAVGQTEFVASPHPPNPTSSVSSALGQQLNPPFISLPHVSTAVGQPASLVLQNSTKTSTSTALQQDQSEALPAVVQSTTTPSKAVRPQSSPDLSRFPHSRTMTTAVTPSQCQTTPRPSHAGAAGMSGTPTIVFLPEDPPLCPICYERRVSAVISPCGHKMCTVCAIQIQELGQTCPHCRGVIYRIESM